MNAATHTAGPWRWFDLQPRNHWAGIAVVARDPDAREHERDIATLPKGSEANARLIAAAPALLEALVMVRDADDDCARDGLPTIPPAARARIDAAIAKAEDQS